MIYVTHDQVEAMTMADKIVVLNAGNIEQVGSPLELYRRPKNLFRRRLHRLAYDELRRGRRGAHPPTPARRSASAQSTSPIIVRRSRADGTVGVAPSTLGADTFVHVHTDGKGASGQSAPASPVNHDEV